jgi:hypothetical protein
MNKPTTKQVHWSEAIKAVSLNKPLLLHRPKEFSTNPVCVIEESRIDTNVLYARTVKEKGLIITFKDQCEFFEMPEATVAEGDQPPTNK